MFVIQYISYGTARISLVHNKYICIYSICISDFHFLSLIVSRSLRSLTNYTHSYPMYVLDLVTSSCQLYCLVVLFSYYLITITPVVI